MTGAELVIDILAKEGIDEDLVTLVGPSCPFTMPFMNLQSLIT